MNLFSFLLTFINALGKPSKPKEELYTFEEAFCLMKYYGKRIQPSNQLDKYTYIYYDNNKNAIYETHINKRYTGDSGWFQVKLLSTLSQQEMLGMWRVLENEN